MDTQSQLFDSYVCVGDSIDIETEIGKRYRATIIHDDQSHIDDDDMHNVDQSVTGCSDEEHAKSMTARAAWFNDEWFYCGIMVTELCRSCGNPTEYCASLWSIEANHPNYWQSAYLTSIAHQLISEVA